MRGLKLGVIGAGSMGRHHIRILSSLPGVTLTAIAEPNMEQSKSLPEILHPLVHLDYHDLFPKTDAICIVTPTQTHFEIARDCLNSNKHVLIEKPFTGNSGLARTLFDLSKSKGLVLAAGFIERFNPAFHKLLKEIKGEKIIGLDIKRFSSFPERITDADVVFDMMIHDLDLFLQIISDDFGDIRAKGERIRTNNLDRVVVTLTHKHGAISRLEANRVFGSITRKIAVTTEKFMAEADLLKKTLYLRDFSCPTPSTVPVKAVDQLTEELKDFILSVKGKRKPAVPCEDVLRVLSLAEEIEKLCL